ncbi:MAG: hypothetical protein IAF08_06805 [Rhizobacter sp.]|nr:hypothetical protein [Chlorobiales bacterium]
MQAIAEVAISRPAELSHEALRREQEKTLKSPRRKYGLLAKMLFWGMDLTYGRKQTLSKFKVLEVIARVPYQSWEHVAYIALTHTYGKLSLARNVFEFVKESRHQQDNEQWHLLLIEEMVQRKSIKENFFMYRFMPQVVAFLYYHVSWLLYVIKPELSYSLNADFEDHAEHEYMAFVAAHPEFETESFESEFKAEYRDFNSVADLFRQIGLDERMHKLESIDHIEHPRFA